MKRFLLIVAVYFLAFSTAFSTEQIADILIIGNDTVYLKSFPLDYIRILQDPFDYDGYSFPHTGCYRGYVATWQVIDENLVLKEVQKIDSIGTKLNVIEYFENGGYSPKTINGYVVADWYSDTLKFYDFFSYNLSYKFDRFYISKDYLSRKERKIELVFENGKLTKNNIIPIENYKIGDALCLDIYYYQNWLVGYKSIPIQGVIRENNGKKVRIEIFSWGSNKKCVKRKIQKEFNIDNFWVNPRYCKNVIEHCH